MEEFDKNETKEHRFKRLAAYRTNAVIDRLRVLGNCANKSTYGYSEEEIRKMFSVIEEELQDVKSKFKSSKKDKFTF